jgi:hypothetical protein
VDPGMGACMGIVETKKKKKAAEEISLLLIFLIWRTKWLAL